MTILISSPNFTAKRKTACRFGEGRISQTPPPPSLLQKSLSGKKMSDSSDSDSEEEFGQPQLVRETYTTSRPKPNPRLEHFKNVIRQNQGRNKIPLPDLQFYQEQILSQIPREEITRKKVREFVKNPSGKTSAEMIMKFLTT